MQRQFDKMEEVRVVEVSRDALNNNCRGTQNELSGFGFY